MAIYRYGKRITAAQMRETIKSANQWTDEQYRKQYDLFKNKLRFYEEVQRSRGVKGVETQSPQELLYKIAKAKQHYGSEYKPSQEVEQIMSVTAHSISKGRRVASATKSKAYLNAVSNIVNIRFEGFVGFYGKAKEITEKITDPVKQEEALSKLAEHIHEQYPRAGRDKGGGTFAQGETYGSGDSGAGDDFDLSPWLEDAAEETNEDEE